MAELKAIIYKTGEWDPKLLHFRIPTFPVEKISGKVVENLILDGIRLKKDEVLCIAATDESILAAQAEHIAAAAYVNPGYEGQSYAGVPMVIEGFEEVDAEFLERIFRRCHGIPWVIAETGRCRIREAAITDLEALEKMYAKEGISFRLDAEGKKIPGFVEPLFPHEEEKEYQRAYISNMYGYYGYGMWLVFDRMSHQLIGRAGLEHRDFPEGTELEMGYVIDPDWQHKGIATEVCTAIMEYAGNYLDFPRLNALTERENAASIALLEKIGFSCVGETHVTGSRTLRYVYEFCGGNHCNHKENKI